MLGHEEPYSSSQLGDFNGPFQSLIVASFEIAQASSTKMVKDKWVSLLCEWKQALSSTHF